MPLKDYGVLKCKLSKNRNGIYYKRESGKSPHFQIRCEDGDGNLYRIAINVQSQEAPSELLFLADEKFNNKTMIAQLGAMEMKFTSLKSKKAALALDFVRGGLFKPGSMQKIPPNVPGTDNDLSDILEKYIQLMAVDNDARLYVFGEPWGPETGKKDTIFSFTPGRGVHDVHMNQGNSKDFAKDDGTWQDGALLMQLPSQKKWIAIYLAFQSQSFKTDDKTGHTSTSAPPKPIKKTATPPAKGVAKKAATKTSVASKAATKKSTAKTSSNKTQSSKAKKTKGKEK